MLSLFLVVTFNYSIFIWQLSSQKCSFRQELFETKLNTLEIKQFAAQDLYKNVAGTEWCDDNSEIRINGEMYEVMAVRTSGDISEVYVLKDKHETELFASYFLKQKKNNDLLLNILKVLAGLDQPGESLSGPQNAINHCRESISESSSILLAGHLSRTAKPPLA